MSENEKQARKAIALKYNEETDPAPKLIAKGKDAAADEIIQIAKQHNIPIQEDAALVQFLTELEINETIPEELYEAVAEIFAFIYRIEKEIN